MLSQYGLKTQALLGLSAKDATRVLETRGKAVRLAMLTGRWGGKGYPLALEGLLADTKADIAALAPLVRKEREAAGEDTLDDRLLRAIFTK